MKRTNSRLRLVSSFLDGSKRWFLAAILSTIGLALTNMLTPQIVRVTVDSVLGSEPFDLPPFLADLLNRLGGAEVLREKLWMIGVVIVGIATCWRFPTIGTARTARETSFSAVHPTSTWSRTSFPNSLSRCSALS